nr:glycerol-3-phosphate acyltransferase [Paenibacillus sp. HB172176]
MNAMGYGPGIGMAVVVALCGFLSGSLMFSYLLGRLAKKRITEVGDGNPGAINLWKSSGFKLGLAGIALDFLKGFLPVLWAVSMLDGNALIGAALAPILGHAFSPFLRGKGGKAIAVTFGVWSALTRFEAALAYAVMMAILLFVVRTWSKGKLARTAADGLQVLAGMLMLGCYLVLRGFPPAILWIWAGNLAVLGYKHRAELAAMKRLMARESGR